MSWIIMGIDECGAEFRPRFPQYASEEEAYEFLAVAREEYQEARSLWVEELRDKAYYSRQRSNEYWEDDYDS